MMNCRLIAIIFAFSLSAAPAAEPPQTVAGKVFLDANANGKLDPNEKGLPGVRITDGVQFVASGSDGSYSLQVSADPIFPYRPSQVVSVCWPSGKWPSGKRWWRMSEIEDAKGVHFGLRDQEQKLPFMFGHITDDHSAGGVVKTFGENFPHMAETVKFVVETGDLGYATADGAEKMFADILANGRTLPVPIFYTPGNHDYVGIHSPEWSKLHPLYGAGAYTKYLGPVRWSFDCAGMHFVGVDWARPEGAKLECGVPGVAREWLRRDLDAVPAESRVFLFTHFPFSPGGKKFKSLYVYGGHSHHHAVWGGGDHVLTTQIALWGGGTCGLTRIDEQGVGLFHRCACCRWGAWQEAARNGFHHRFCPLGFWPATLLPRLAAIRAPLKSLADKPLDSARETIEGGPADRDMQIELEIVPGTAKQMGLTVKGEDRTVSIAWDRQWLLCDGIRLPMPLREWEKTLHLQVLVERDGVQFRANNMYLVERPLKAGRPAVAAFAEGGAATLKKFEVSTYDPAKIGELNR